MSSHNGQFGKPRNEISATGLGSSRFREDYRLRYAYVAGSMFKGIASVELVVALAKAGCMGFFGTGGLDLVSVEKGIQRIQSELVYDEPYGMNLLCHATHTETEFDLVNLFLKYGIKTIEAAAFVRITPALIYYRIKGLKRDEDGNFHAANRIIAKVSHPEIAAAFLAPPPRHLVNDLVSKGLISADEAAIVSHVPMADDLCVESDSGGHTDMGVALVLLPAIRALRDDSLKKHSYSQYIRIGAAGGIGTPQAVAAAFILGADFVMTGSINQCTVEANTSDSVKDMLQQLQVRDTTYAPSGDMFELGTRVQVMKRGVFFPARANRLYELWRQHASLDDLDPETSRQIQEQYFGKSFDAVYAETKEHYLHHAPQVIEQAERDPKRKMALIFRWYFVHSNRLSRDGDVEQRMNYQVHCGPALGAFNQWVRGTDLENWRNRRVDAIAQRLMVGAAQHLNEWYRRVG